jgi:apolipoprotein N-acyltransferase
MLALSFPPIGLMPLAFVALVPLFFYLRQPASFRRTMRAGALTAAFFFGIHISFLVATGRYAWFAFPGYLAIVGFHICNFFVFILAVVIFRSYLSMPFLYTAPFAWITCERLRAVGDTAFPWSALGYSLTNFPFLAQFADLVGVYGVSFWLVVLNVLLFETILAGRHTARRRKYVVLFLIVFGGVNIYNAVRWFQGIGPVSGQIRVAVLQPNIPQKIKWDERYSREILKKIFAMNQQASRNSSDLVIWPETAIPYYIDETQPFNLTEMGELPPGNTHILTGILDHFRDSYGRAHYYNAAFLFDSRGVMLAKYKKIILVPGSERYPYRDVIGFTRPFFQLQRVSSGAMDPGTEATVFTIPGGKFSVMICYESGFPDLVRAFRRAGANFLVNITNDAWFGRSLAPYQQASFLVLRAIENRSAIVRCANTGVSGFVDPLGRWQHRTDIFTQGIISSTVPVTQRLTFYTRFGDLILYLSYPVLVGFFLMALAKKYSIALPGRRSR